MNQDKRYSIHGGEKLERLLRSGELPPILESHLAKYRSLMPSLALIFDLADSETFPESISKVAALKAIVWTEYLETHARRVYGLYDPETQAARELAERIQKGQVPDGMTVRELNRARWTGLNDPELVKVAFDTLEDLNWIRVDRVEPGSQGGAAFRNYPNQSRVGVEPMNYPVTYSKPTAKTDKTYYQGSFVGFVSSFSRGKAVPSLDKLRAALRERQSDKESFVSFGSSFSQGKKDSSRPDPDLDTVLSMRLSEFSRSGSWLRIRSKVLGEDLIMAANDASDIPGGIPVYTVDELKLLFGLNLEELREVHRFKKHFKGSIYDRRNKPTGGIQR